MPCSLFQPEPSFYRYIKEKYPSVESSHSCFDRRYLLSSYSSFAFQAVHVLPGAHALMPHNSMEKNRGSKRGACFEHYLFVSLPLEILANFLSSSSKSSTMIPSGTLLLLLWHKFTQNVNRDFLNGDANSSVTGMISISSSHLLRSILLLHKSVPFLSAGSNLASIRDELKRIKGKTVVKLLKTTSNFEN